jgi:hypothetical protein
MSVRETAPPTGILEFVKRHPVVSHQVPAAPIRPNSDTGLPSRIAVVGNYLPRQCGIATFTTDLCDAISMEFGTIVRGAGQRYGIWLCLPGACATRSAAG